MGGLVGTVVGRAAIPERLQDERQLAGIRVLLAAPLFLMDFVVPVTMLPSGSGRPLLGLYALLAIASVRLMPLVHPAHVAAAVLAAIDVAVGAWLLSFGAGPLASLVVLFALCVAAHRRGLAGLAVGIAAATTLLVAMPFAADSLNLNTGLSVPHANTVLAQCAFVLVAGVGIGCFTAIGAKSQKIERALGSASARLDLHGGITQTLAVTFDTFLQEFEGRRAIALAQEIPTGVVVGWQADREDGPGTKSLRPVRVAALNGAELDALPAAHAWWGRRERADGRVNILGVDAAGDLLPSMSVRLPDGIRSLLGSFEHAMCLTARGRGEWRGWLFVLDPLPIDRSEALSIGTRLIGQLTPVLDAAYLLHRIRTKSAGNERHRIGRELHDGIIQSTIGLELQLHALAAPLAEQANPLGAELNRLAEVLRSEVVAVREVMHQQRRPEVPAHLLIQTLAELINRFGYETGISARFITPHDTVDLAPRTCGELVRIGQEALVNVRKHSGARTVTVRLTCEGPACHISIDDDGHGFPFSGRLSETAVEFAGPRVITQRVRLLAGDINVESVPDQGSRIEISIPLTTTHAAFG